VILGPARVDWYQRPSRTKQGRVDYQAGKVLARHRAAPASPGSIRVGGRHDEVRTTPAEVAQVPTARVERHLTLAVVPIGSAAMSTPFCY